MSQPTTLAAALTLLARHNAWRRDQPNFVFVSAAIELVCEVVPGLLAALEQIEQVPGNLSDAVTTMRAIARAARAKAGGAA